MTRKRWEKLMNGIGELTPKEIKAGYHFCSEWDAYLVGPGEWDMLACCSCLRKSHPIYVKTEKYRTKRQHGVVI